MTQRALKMALAEGVWVLSRTPPPSTPWCLLCPHLFLLSPRISFICPGAVCREQRKVVTPPGSYTTKLG